MNRVLLCSYTGMKTLPAELDGQYNFNGDNEYSTQSEFSVAGGNGGEWHFYFLVMENPLDLEIHCMIWCMFVIKI